MRNVIYKTLLAVALIPALSFACGDYCDYSSSYDSYGSYDYSYDSAWSGAYQTGIYQSAYDIYQTTYDVDVTTTTYMPIYGSDMGSCSSLVTPCGGGYENPNLWDTPIGLTNPTYPDLGVIPRDPNQPLPLDPYNPYAQMPMVPPLGNQLPRDPNQPFFPPMSPLPPPPIAMFPPQAPFPPNTWPLPPTYPPYNPNNPNPQNPTPITPTPVTPGTPPTGSNTPRDPRTTYNPPTPPTWGGCDGVIVPCPGGPVTRPSPQIGGTPVAGGNNVPINRTVPTNPTSPVFNSPTHNSPGSTPQRNEVPRGSRMLLGR